MSNDDILTAMGFNEESKSGSKTTNYDIPDETGDEANSKISISGAPTGAIKKRIHYEWNIDHDFVSPLVVR